MPLPRSLLARRAGGGGDGGGAEICTKGNDGSGGVADCTDSTDCADSTDVTDTTDGADCTESTDGTDVTEGANATDDGGGDGEAVSVRALEGEALPNGDVRRKDEEEEGGEREEAEEAEGQEGEEGEGGEAAAAAAAAVAARDARAGVEVLADHVRVLCGRPRCVCLHCVFFFHQYRAGQLQTDHDLDLSGQVYCWSVPGMIQKYYCSSCCPMGVG